MPAQILTIIIFSQPGFDRLQYSGKGLPSVEVPNWKKLFKEQR